MSEDPRNFWCYSCLVTRVSEVGALCDICEGFARVRRARQEKIDRYNQKRASYRQPYKEDDHD